MRFIVAILMIAAGAYLSFWANRRAFNRRNMAGVEEFKSYGDALAKQGLEKIARIGGRIILIIGVFFLIGSFLSSGRNTTSQPVNPPAQTTTAP